jgi:hypothetical protein
VAEQAEHDEFFDWLVEHEQAGASLDDVLTKIDEEHERHLAEIDDRFASWEEAERQADRRPADDELEEARRAAMHEATALADKPPPPASTPGKVAEASRQGRTVAELCVPSGLDDSEPPKVAPCPAELDGPPRFVSLALPSRQQRLSVPVESPIFAEFFRPSAFHTPVLRGSWVAASTAPRRLDRRLGCGGRPAARRVSTGSSSRGSPGDSEPEPPGHRSGRPAELLLERHEPGCRRARCRAVSYYPNGPWERPEKEDAMRSVDLQDMPYSGDISKPGVWLGATDPCCTRCGTPLGGRRVQVVRKPEVTIHVYRCGCGRRRLVRRGRS